MRYLSILFLSFMAVSCRSGDGGVEGSNVPLTEGDATNQVPVITLYEPIEGTRYAWSDAISFSALVSDDDPASSLVINLYSDIDGYLGGADLSTSSTLSTSVTGLSPGTHTLSVAAQDPDGEEDEVYVTVSVEENRAPTTPLIEIRPSSASNEDDLEAVVTVASTDADGDAIRYEWTWMVDGVDSGVEGQVVSADQTEETEVWTVTAVATDGQLFSDPVSASIAIGQDGPSVTINIDPAQPHVDDELTCTWHAGDAYGGTVTSQGAWWVGGVYISDASLPLSGVFLKYDVVTCEVTAESERGLTIANEAVQIQNSTPTISAMDISPSLAYTNNDLTCQPTTTDADDDPISYAWEWYVRDSESASTTLVSTEQVLASSWFIKNNQVWCQAQADDGEEPSAWRASGALVIQNSPPTAPEIELSASEVTAGASVDCAVTTAATDADLDELTYNFQWTIDGAVESANGSTFYDTAGLAGSLLGCSAQAMDNEDLPSPWSVEVTAQIIE